MWMMGKALIILLKNKMIFSTMNNLEFSLVDLGVLKVKPYLFLLVNFNSYEATTNPTNILPI